MHDNVAARSHHEATQTHKEKALVFIERSQTQASRKKREDDAVRRELERITKAAESAHSGRSARSGNPTVSSTPSENAGPPQHHAVSVRAVEKMIHNQGGGSFFDELHERAEEAAKKEKDPKPAPKENKAAQQAPSGLNRKERRALALLKEGSAGEVGSTLPPMEDISPEAITAFLKSKETEGAKAKAPAAAAAAASVPTLSVEQLLQMKREVAANRKEQSDNAVSRAVAQEKEAVAPKAAGAEVFGFGEWSKAEVIKPDSDSDSDSEGGGRRKMVIKERVVQAKEDDSSEEDFEKILKEAKNGWTETTVDKEDAEDAAGIAAAAAKAAKAAAPKLAFKAKKRKAIEMPDDGDEDDNENEADKPAKPSFIPKGKNARFKRK